MKYSSARQGRTFVIRLEDGDVVHEQIEWLAREEKIVAGALIILGGADAKSTLVVGPEDGRARSITPMTEHLENVHEVAGTGTLFVDEQGNPALHMHMACGRNDKSITGCIRQGVKVWQVMEVILFEIIDTTALRAADPDLGLNLLQP